MHKQITSQKSMRYSQWRKAVVLWVAARRSAPVWPRGMFSVSLTGVRPKVQRWQHWRYVQIVYMLTKFGCALCAAALLYGVRRTIQFI